MDKPLTQKEFNYIYGKVPRLCVDVLIQTKAGILLTKRSIEPYKGMWHIPGGTVYKGETLEKAVKRVAKAELGVDVKILDMLGLVDFPEIENGQHAVGVEFLVKIVSGKLRGSFQGKEFAYFSKIPKDTIALQGDFLQETFGLKYE